jgi:hypothetical protein
MSNLLLRKQAETEMKEIEQEKRTRNLTGIEIYLKATKGSRISINRSTLEKRE